MMSPQPIGHTIEMNQHTMNIKIVTYAKMNLQIAA